MGVQITCDCCAQPVEPLGLLAAGSFLTLTAEDFGYVVCDGCQTKMVHASAAAREFGRRAQSEHYERLMSELRKP